MTRRFTLDHFRSLTLCAWEGHDMNKHTAEPWQFNAGLGVIVDGRSETLATLRHAYDIDGPANAARAVQCVNACAGIEDPAAALALARHAIVELQHAVAQLMPGVRHIAVKDYANLNDAPLAGDKALAALRKA
jgi:hypothetical protein